MHTRRPLPEVRNYHWGQLVSSFTYLGPLCFNLILSRRGAPNSSDIDLIILHPDHVHVPFPAIPSHIERPSGTPKRQNGARSPSFLQAEVVPILESRGIIAATLSGGDLKWQGVVLLPDPDSAIKDDQVAERKRRLTAIEKSDGVYRRADLK